MRQILPDSTSSSFKNPPFPSSEGQFEFVLHALSRSLLKLYNGHFRSLGLTSNEAGVLLQLDWAESFTQTEVAEALGIGKAATGVLIVDLEARGLLCRERSPKDGRRIEVTLTASGQKMVDEIHKHVRALGPKLQNGISQNDLKRTMSTLLRIRANVDRIREEEADSLN